MDDISEDGMLFLQELYRQCTGDAGATFSMFDIGQAVDMDRDKAGTVAEELIGWGYVEVRTLSGGVAIADSGVEKARRLTGEDAESAKSGVQLGAGPLLDAAGAEAAERAVSRLKSGIEALGLGFEPVSEMIADLKSIEAQLSSPRPKTPVVRECFRSILAVLQAAGAAEQSREIKILLGE